jgi:anti-anti-sigma factor
MEVRGRSSGVIKVVVEGRLVMGTQPSLHAFVSDVVANRPVIVLVCMAGVTDMDAHGIGELVATFRLVKRHGGRMALIAPPARARELLSITHLDSVFTMYNSELEALVRLAPIRVAAALRIRPLIATSTTVRCVSDRLSIVGYQAERGLMGLKTRS